MKFAVAALLLATAAPALADASAAFRDGRWPAAIAQGRTEATPASLILAGRAQLAIAAYDTPTKARALELVTLGERDFDAALAKAPGNVEAQLQKAVAIGYRAKLTKAPGLAKDSLKRFIAVRTAHPELGNIDAAMRPVGGHAADPLADEGMEGCCAVEQVFCR